MKICFLAHANSIHTMRWAAYFRDHGHECYIISLTQPVETLKGVTFLIIPHPFQISYEQSNWHYLLQIPTIWRLVHRIQPDIVNAHFLSSYGFLGALICPKSLPLVISLHGSDILIIPKRSKLHCWITVFSLKRARLITSVAQHMTDVLYQYVSIEKPVLTLQYGIDTDIFHPPELIKPRLPIVISIRSMVNISHIEILLQAIACLKNHDLPLQYYLAGNGELRPTLEKQSVEQRVQEIVRFIGQIPRQQMPDTLRQTAIYVSTSTSDGTSISLLEAMACGTFPVVTDIPANREWIQHGVNGLLTQPGSPTDLADNLLHAWRNEPLRIRAISLNWDIIRERGNYKTNMSKIEQAFTKLAQFPDQDPINSK
jgi:glycosyltransferase involved in cell wall biosynthesis